MRGLRGALDPVAREVLRGRPASSTPDVLVVGGGITGAGIAAEAAARGLSVLLLERGDFASGASSRSSKLLHGGLRYLEQYHFGMVAQALGERGRLHARLPDGLATMVPFHYPVPGGAVFDAVRTRAGIALYDAMALVQGMPWHHHHRVLAPAAARREVPALGDWPLEVLFQYGDVITDDARLCLSVLRAAVARGAKVLSRAEVRGLLKDVSGRVSGVRFEDRASGTMHEVRAGLVVNAAGPWVDAVNDLEAGAVRRLRPTKGTHVLVQDFTGGRALTIKSVPDAAGKRRWMFVIPFQGRSLVGTTDTDPPAPSAGHAYLDDDQQATPQEVAYLLDSVNAACPGVALDARDVVGSFAGWRPLLAPPEQRHASDVSREHEVFLTPAGVLCIAGGKLTTYRLMARQLVDAAVLELARRGRVPRTVLPGPVWPEGLRHASSPPGIPDRLLRRFGAEADRVLACGEAHGARDVLAGVDMPDPPLEAEVVWAVLVEGATRPEDVLERRLRLGMLDPGGGAGAHARVVDLMAAAFTAALGWTAEDRRRWLVRQ